MHSHRPLLDRLQLLVSTLTSQVSDSHEREQLRRRLNEITRRWTEIEQDLISEEEGITEMHHLNQQYTDLHSAIDRWVKQAKDLNQQLSNGRTIDVFDQLIPKTKIALNEYQFTLDQFQRLRSRLQRLSQTNRTPEATQKVNNRLKSIVHLRTF